MAVLKGECSVLPMGNVTFTAHNLKDYFFAAEEHKSKMAKETEKFYIHADRVSVLALRIMTH